MGGARGGGEQRVRGERGEGRRGGGALMYLQRVGIIR